MTVQKILVSFILLLLPWSVYSQQDPQRSPALVTRMNDVYQAFKELPKYTRDEETFSDPENEARVQELLDQLKGDFHGPVLSDAKQAKDAGFIATLTTLQDLLADTSNRFREGRKNYARWRVKTITNYCISCHSRYEAEMDYSVENRFPESLSHFEKGELLFATRQFDEAGEQFLKSVHDPETPMQRIEALRNWLVIVTRVHPDPQKAIRALTKLRSSERFAPYEEVEIKGWLTSMRRWQNERKIDISELRRAENLIRRATVIKDSPRDGQGTVEYLRATAILHRELEEGALTQSQRGHALYLLGKAYSVMPEVFASELPDFFLTQCIRLVPGSDDAKNCYRLHYDNVVVGFSGSGGTRIPSDVQANLRELYDVAFGIPRLEGKV